MIWKKIKPLRGINFSDKYVINTDGVIKNVHTGKIYKSTIRDSDKRVYVSLQDINGQMYRLLLNRLVANTFIGDVEGMVVNHIDFDPTNNSVSNLEICTQKYNINYSEIHGRINHKGENNSTAKGIFTEKKVHKICKMMCKVPRIKYSDILCSVNIEVNKNNLDMLSKIRTGKLWVHISEQYDFPSYERRVMCTYSEYRDDIIRLHNENKSIREIADELGIILSTKQERDKFWKYVSRITSI